jgi:hypothetical protein
MLAMSLPPCTGTAQVLRIAGRLACCPRLDHDVARSEMPTRSTTNRPGRGGSLASVRTCR